MKTPSSAAMKIGTARSAVRAAARLSFDAGLSERVVIRFPFVALHPRARFKVDAAAGFLTLRVGASPRPSRSLRSSGQKRGAHCLQLRGQPRNREVPHRVPFLRPASCGNHRRPDYSPRKAHGKGEPWPPAHHEPLRRIDKRGLGALMCLIDGCSFRANRERGIEETLNPRLPPQL